MTIGQKGIDLIKGSEGLVLHAYPDPATGNLPITIGYGSTRHLDGSPFVLGETITQQQAEELLAHDLANFSVRVDSLLTLKVNQNQFDALCSFAYNCGIGNLQSSTLLKKVNANPQDEEISHEFAKWNKAAGKIMQGLIIRRAHEAALYFTPIT